MHLKTKLKTQNLQTKSSDSGCVSNGGGGCCQEQRGYARVAPIITYMLARSVKRLSEAPLSVGVDHTRKDIRFTFAASHTVEAVAGGCSPSSGH